MLTFLGSLCCDRLAAPCVLDGPINGRCFRGCVEQQLLPVLDPGDIVIVDNLGSHKAAATRQMIRGTIARLIRPKTPGSQITCALWFSRWRAIAFSNQPTSMLGTDESSRSVYASNGGVSTSLLGP